MAKFNTSDMRNIVNAFNMLTSDPTARTILESALGSTKYKQAAKSIDKLNDVFISGGGISGVTKDDSEAQAELDNKLNTYKQAYEAYKPKAQAWNNIGNPITKSVFRTVGDSVGIYNGALAALLANSAKGVNHSAVTDNIREGVAGLAPVYAARGAFGTMLGNRFAELSDEITQGFKQDYETTNRQAYATANPGTSGTMYYNLDRGTSKDE